MGCTGGVARAGGLVRKQGSWCGWPALQVGQEEAELQHTSIDVLIRYAVEKHLKDLRVAREEKKEAETREYARLVLRAHFAEDRNEF
jgi:hypothetical protein